MFATAIITALAKFATWKINGATAAILKAAEFDYYQHLAEAEFYKLAAGLTDLFPQYSLAKWITLLKAMAEFQIGYPIPPVDYDPIFQAPYTDPVDYSLCESPNFGGYDLGGNVIIPSAREDMRIRRYIEWGYTLDEAYQTVAGTYAVIPPLNIQACLKDVYREKTISSVTGHLEFPIPEGTCRGFLQCNKEYTEGRADWQWRTAEEDRRMRIAPGLWSPSMKEGRSIRATYARTRDIQKAYRDAKIESLMPKFPGAPLYIAQALTNKPTASLYRIIKSGYQIYMLYYLTPTPGSPPISPPTSPPGPTLPEKDNTVRDVAIVSALFYILRKLT